MLLKDILSELKIGKKRKSREKDDKEEWGRVLVEYKGKVIPTAAFVSIKTGVMKIGTHTIKISRFRLDMGGYPIRNVSQIDISNRLKIPVGTNLYS